MLFLVIGISTCSPNTCYHINIKNNVKLVKFHVISDVVSYKSGLIYIILKGINTFLFGVFVSPHGGLGGPPSFLAC
jgi:hypothetical protein